MMTLGWGIIGIGHIADTQMAPAIAADANSTLVSVVSRDQGRADAFAEKHGAVHATTSYDELLARADVDVVLITTPNSQHAEQVIAAARAGKHVYCDKPLATTVADAERAVAACAEASVKLGMGFHNRAMPCFREAKRVLESGVIGEPISVYVEVSAGARELQSWRADPTLAGHGTMANVGVHLYDVLRFVMDAEITTVSAFLDAPVGQMERMAVSTLVFDNGVVAQINANERTPFPHNDFVIHGSKGRITGVGLTRTSAGGELQVLTADGETRTPFPPASEAHRDALSNFCRALVEGRDPSPSGRDGLQIVRVVEGMARSSRDGVHCRLPSAR
jgi:1,5-anhydro-D-fructose reductase (1,5-anhydro-D-mannitol-forming)